jgi:integrase
MTGTSASTRPAVGSSAPATTGCSAADSSASAANYHGDQPREGGKDEKKEEGRTGNGEGSIRLRPDGRWEARYTTEVGGAVKRPSVFGTTRQEAADRLRAALNARADGHAPASAKETAGGFLESWLKSAESTIRPRTRDSYEQITHNHLMPRFGRIPLIRLQPQQVSAFYRDLLASGKSAKTVSNIHGVLHKALDQAYRWRLVPTNVADLVDPPRIPHHEMQALTPEEAKQVLAAAEGDPLEALFRLAIAGGLRQGELLALRWPQVDLDHSVVRVIAGLEQRRGHAPVVAQPKSARSRRQVDIGAATVEALRSHKAQAIEAALAEGHTYDRNGFVFSQPDGRPLTMSIVYKAWLKLNTKAEVKRVRFHDLRHTCATLLLTQGVNPKVVSEQLGHASIVITLDRYSHVIPTMQQGGGEGDGRTARPLIGVRNRLSRSVPS